LRKNRLAVAQITLHRQKKVNWIAVLIDFPVQIPPLAFDLDVGLVNPDRATMQLAEEPQPFLDQCA